ncbi:MAG TPA: acetyl-CoA hydrolase/transferase C-terminal domain-containing protein [Stellaceae bacterium]
MPTPIRIDADDVPRLLRPGMTVFVEGSTAEPLPLAEALARAPEASAGVTYAGVLIPGINRFDYAGLHPEARAVAFFVGPAQRASFAAGRVRLLPLHYSAQYAWLETVCPVDLALIQVAPPDAAGNCSLGAVADFVPAVLGKAGRIVAEVNARMPALPGAPSVSYGRLDYVVETDRPLIEVADEGGGADEIASIAENAAALIRDGDTVQIGIGRVQNTILSRLADRRHIGFHSGMITDAVMDLVRAGALTGARKSRDWGRIVTGAAVGTQALYDFLRSGGEGAGLVDMRPVSYTHAATVLAGIDDFVSINSALEVDLLGQVNCETIGGRQVSGVGGFVDFVRGARLSKGGRSIVAFGATGKRGAVSRIVARLGEGAVVSSLRSDIDCVVTEHGVAALRDRSVDERAEALVEIAAPQFRDGLQQAWREMRARM